MRSRLRSLHCVGVLLAVSLTAGSASADFKTLAARIPGEANAIAFVDVEALLNSPLSETEGWREKMTFTYAKKPVVVPPDSHRVVMAALIDPIGIEPIWQVAVVDVAKAPSLDMIVRNQRGYLDKLGQTAAVWSPLNAYFIQMEPLVLATTSPADRQFAARWVARKPGLAGNSISAYLASAAGSVNATTPIVMAIDLQDVTCAAKVRRRIAAEKFESIEGKGLDIEELSQVIGSIKGLTINVSVGKEITCKGAFDFGRSAAVLQGNCKPLLMEMLSQMGAYMDDFDSWKVGPKGQQVTFEGKLSIDGLRRLLSLVQTPAPVNAGSNAKPANEKEAKAAASKEYFTAVKEILEDLGKRSQGGQTVKLTAISAWMKQDAAEISRLPILDVDADLVKFGADVAARLSDAARVLNLGTLEAHARTTGITTGFVDRHYYESYDQDAGEARADNRAERRTAMAQADAQRRQATSEERAKAVSQAGEILKGLMADMQRVRIELTNRYQVEF